MGSLCAGLCYGELEREAPGNSRGLVATAAPGSPVGSVDRRAIAAFDHPGQPPLQDWP